MPRSALTFDCACAIVSFDHGSSRASYANKSISAPSPKRYPKRAFSNAYGAFDIDSMPPATMTSASPSSIRRAPWTIAIIPDAQTLLIVSNVIVFARPALYAA